MLVRRIPMLSWAFCLTMPARSSPVSRRPSISRWRCARHGGRCTRLAHLDADACPAGPEGAAGEPGRTAATSSRLLYDLLGAVYDWLGFDAVADPVFRDLVIARIVEPTSKLDSPAGPGRSGCRDGVLQDD